MKINIIAACDRNRLIGADGKIPWYIHKDLKRFKELTIGNAVIMGRGTFESMGRKPLPGRLNVVITSNSEYGRNRDGAIFVSSYKDALKVCNLSRYESVFIIGGQQVYEEAMPYADTIYLTKVYYTIKEGNNKRYFPTVDYHDWGWEKAEIHAGYSFCIANRRKEKTT
jgi:dihydrofolate reductase